jgi:hypothetical protein
MQHAREITEMHAKFLSQNTKERDYYFLKPRQDEKLI